ncbi:DsbA family oxidoreductase [Peloplasma aerotolerans]|uniref:DsbA family oxidoreductase n=1 Tax=Peloplasma aerotolerans TaxID=3044389 RepID=A0AAW6U9X2_9MOLU|nr:DsbA family oxidoreductase [Mariniplasma sp. M4Ah]MDI6453515.1 DsbA family oxidoreductase [Mariniplasma sp. M4Ah]MDR4968551.1 DsbA family oxidoreductase [Acholeplasmataceae bacterium]
MKIEIWSDFACPFCYIGKKRFDQALSEFKHKNQVEVIYKAYQLNPDAPKVMKKNAYETFAEGHGTTVEQAKQRFEMFTQNAKTVGLTYNYEIIQMTNTFDAHRLAKWANQFGLEDVLTNRLMKAYFTDGLNIANHQSLTNLSKEVGLDEKEALKILATNQYHDQVIAEQQESRQLGVQGVPFFVLNRKYGISGAQQKEYFAQALDQIWQEENPLKVLNEADQNASCDHDECGIE